jgi:hypothetical protein
VSREQKKAIETLAIEMGLDISELVEAALVQFYETLGQGKSGNYQAIARDEGTWRDIAMQAREKCEQERKAVRSRQ